MLSSADLGSAEIRSYLAGLQYDAIAPERTSWGIKDWLNSPISEQLRNQIVTFAFVIALSLVAVASIYDAFLVYKYRDCITEQNPICRWLISFDPESVSVFLGAKLASTFLVVLIVSLLFKFWRRAGVLSVISLLGFQVGLMFYLHLADNL